MHHAPTVHDSSLLQADRELAGKPKGNAGECSCSQPTLPKKQTTSSGPGLKHDMGQAGASPAGWQVHALAYQLRSTHITNAGLGHRVVLKVHLERGEGQTGFW